MPETPEIPEELPLAEVSAVGAEAAHGSVATKENDPMLDVHPAHHAANGWKEFLVHIATIVLGLLIAVGLEQLVEYIHHLHQIAETREVLRREREENRLRMAYTTAGFRLQVAQLQNNLFVLQYAKQHPGTSLEKLPGVMVWSYHNRSGWLAAQQTGVTALMPREEVARNESLYALLVGVDTAFETFKQSFSTAIRYQQGDPDITHMLLSQLDDEMVLLEDAMQANRTVGARLQNLRSFAPDFDTISPEELDTLGPATTDAEKARLAPATTLTDARLAKTKADFDETSKDFAQKMSPK